MRLLCAALALLSWSKAAPGQVIRGTVVSEGTSAPLRGAVVTLIDASGNPGLRVLTDVDGSFAVRAPSAGSWMLEARAIGYAPRKTSARQVGAGETVVERV